MYTYIMYVLVLYYYAIGNLFEMFLLPFGLSQISDTKYRKRLNYLQVIVLSICGHIIIIKVLYRGAKKTRRESVQ